MTDTELYRIEILPRLADRLHPERGDPIPNDLIGARIVAIGCLASPDAVEGGGKGMAIAGIVCGIIGCIVAVLWISNM